MTDSSLPAAAQSTAALPHRRAFGAGVALILLGVIWITGLLEPLSGWLGGQRLQASNAAYIEQVQANAAAELATLGAVLAVVDVVASVEVGFNFVASAHIGIGHALESLRLLLTHALEALALSTAAFEVLSLLLSISDAVSGTLFALALISIGALCLARAFAVTDRLHDLIEDAALLSSALFLIAYIVLPYSIQVSAWCSSEITYALHAATRDGLAALHSDVVERATQAKTAADWTAKGTAVSAYEHVANDLPQKTKAAADLLWSFWARMITHALVIPLLSALVLKMLTHRLLRLALSR